MSQTLGRVQQLLAEGEVRISDHGYDELAADGILAGEVIAGVQQAVALVIFNTLNRGSGHNCYHLCKNFF